MTEPRIIRILSTAVKATLILWLLFKGISLLLTASSLGAIDLTCVNPSIESMLQLMLFGRNTGLDVALFIVFLVIIAACYPTSYLLLSGRVVFRRLAFIGYAVLLIFDAISLTVSLALFGFFDTGYLIVLIVSVLLIICLLYYGKTRILGAADDPDTAPDDAPDEAENNS